MWFVEGRLKFEFPPPLRTIKYDDWSFYRNQFGNAFGGARAVDFVCIDGPVVWLVEVKDYRGDRQRTKTIDLGIEVAMKVRDTLAGLVAASANANEQSEREFAMEVLQRQQFNVVLHLEQTAKPSKLFPRVADPANLVLKLKQLLKAVDPHPCVVDQVNVNPRMGWHVTG